METWVNIKRTNRLALLLSVGISITSLCSCLAQATGTNPTYWKISQFGPNGSQYEPAMTTLSAAEETQVKNAVTNAPPFPRYLYSGCHDRAHAMYLLLPGALQPKVMKIWVLTPSIYTAAIHGTIHSTRSEASYKAVDWAYHVALAYQSNNGLRIIDPALRPNEVLSQDSWFSEMDASPLSIWTLTAGSVYQFYLSPPDANALNHQVWDGNTFRYEGQSVSEDWIPAALARDAVGVEAMNGTACPSYVSVATDPGALLTKLNSGDTGGLGEPCKPSLDRFLSEKSKWRAALAAIPPLSSTL